MYTVVVMTSQTYTTIYIDSYEGVTLEAPPAQMPHMGMYTIVYKSVRS